MGFTVGSLVGDDINTGLPITCLDTGCAIFIDQIR
jgi:hypothetical protein